MKNLFLARCTDEGKKIIRFSELTLIKVALQLLIKSFPLIGYALSLTTGNYIEQYFLYFVLILSLII